MIYTSGANAQQENCIGCITYKHKLKNAKSTMCKAGIKNLKNLGIYPNNGRKQTVHKMQMKMQSQSVSTVLCNKCKPPSHALIPVARNFTFYEQSYYLPYPMIRTSLTTAKNSL